MSIGFVGGIAGAAAGAPLAQVKGTESERAQQAAATQAFHVEGEQKAETAAGIGETDGQEHQTAERDADGRRPWTITPPKAKAAPTDDQDQPPQSKDPPGQSGSLLDLSG
jgi:hypothetical protein